MWTCHASVFWRCVRGMSKGVAEMAARDEDGERLCWFKVNLYRQPYSRTMHIRPGVSGMRSVGGLWVSYPILSSRAYCGERFMYVEAFDIWQVFALRLPLRHEPVEALFFDEHRPPHWSPIGSLLCYNCLCSLASDTQVYLPERALLGVNQRDRPVPMKVTV